MSNSERQPETEAPRRPSAQVRVLYADDMRWSVREMPAPALDRRSGPHLLFEGEGVMRRVRFFPADWYILTDAQLYALTDRIRLV